MILIFDSHPVQYKAPVYQRLQQIRPGSFRVIYATDSTMRGHRDQEFQTVVIWDTPLLDGYDYTVLNSENGTPFTGFRSLTGRGVAAALRDFRPQAALISQFLYAFDAAAYFGCLRRRIPIWIRHETQDEAFARPLWKAALRGAGYRVAYAALAHAFYIGELNREHLRRHGVPDKKMSRAAYCTPDRGTPELRTSWRREVRTRLGIPDEAHVVLFSGKFIDKKNPELLLAALEKMTSEARERFHLIYVGAGPLEAELKRQSARFPGRIHFTGFVNQAEIPQYYAAADILVLPSRRAGETWGLVVNEALQAGCGVVVSKAAGCHREFGAWERVRVIEPGDGAACARGLLELAKIDRSLTWCEERMRAYSVEAAADALADRIDRPG